MKVSSIVRGGLTAAAIFGIASLGSGIEPISNNATTVSAKLGSKSSNASAYIVSRPKNENYYYQYRNIENVYQGEYGGDWGQCDYVQRTSYTQVASCSQNVTTSASIDGSLGNVSAPEISALLGFSVTWSRSEGVGSGFSVTIPPGGYGPLLAGSEYWQHYVVDQYRLCTIQGNCDSWGGNQANTVQRYASPTFEYAGVF